MLPDFSLDIRAGETVALVGHTGAGKSSVAQLVARFYEFQGGELLIDGRDIRRWIWASIASRSALVPQEPFLFSGTVRDNIRYGRPDATDEAGAATRRRHIASGDWLADLPDGLDTDVGERGASLSMGQRQLVALARVLLKDPAIFILDEATASVDPFTEAQIQEGLETIMRDRTAIVIAHRLSTVQTRRPDHRHGPGPDHRRGQPRRAAGRRAVTTPSCTTPTSATSRWSTSIIGGRRWRRRVNQRATDTADTGIRNCGAVGLPLKRAFTLS